MDIRTSIVSNNQKSNTSQAGANKRQNKSKHLIFVNYLTSVIVVSSIGSF